jgi:hypothetical protein
MVVVQVDKNQVEDTGEFVLSYYETKNTSLQHQIYILIYCIT